MCSAYLELDAPSDDPVTAFRDRRSGVVLRLRSGRLVRVPRVVLATIAALLLPGLMIAGASLARADDLAQEPSAPLETLRFDLGGRERNAKLFVPSANVRPERLVVMLHGAGGDAERVRKATAWGLERVADEAAWVVAYPDGIGGTWHDCRRAVPFPAKQQDVDDVAFLSSLINRLRERFDLAAEVVTVAGFSNGGHMALRLAVERPETIGAYAVVAAQLPTPSASECETAAPALGSLWVHGSEDPFLPASGGASSGLRGEDLGAVHSVEETAAWATRAFSGVIETPSKRLPERDGNTKTTVEQKEWRSSDGAVVRQLLLHGSGHVIPQNLVPFPALVGPSAGDVDFAETLADFLTAVDEGASSQSVELSKNATSSLMK